MVLIGRVFESTFNEHARDESGGIGAHLGTDGRSLYFTSDRRSKASWPRTPRQMQDDLVRWQSWDNGADNIWYVSLASVLDAHHAQ